MSDELIKSLNQRISELEKAKTNLEVAVRQERREKKEVKAQLDDLVSQADAELGQTAETIAALEAERDELKGRAEAAPDEKDTRIRELETAVRTRDYRDEFTKHAGKELAEGVTVEDLWHFAGFDPAKADKLEAAQITELVGKVREAKPVLFVKPDPAGNAGDPARGSQKPLARPLVLGDSGSRGARDTTSAPSISRSEMSRPGWMTKNKAAAEAFKSGTLTVTDD